MQDISQYTDGWFPSYYDVNNSFSKLQQIVMNPDRNYVIMTSTGNKEDPPGVSRSKEKAMKPVNFKVEKIKKADVDGFYVIYVKYDNSDKTYNYIRKARDTNINTCKAVVIEGVEIKFNKYSYNVISIERLYDTAGVKRRSTAGMGKKNSKFNVNYVDDDGNKVKKEDVFKKAQKKSLFEEVDPDADIKHSKYDTIKACLQCKIPVYLAGPAGSGKNFTVEQIADELGWEFYFSNSVQQEYKLTGFIDAAGDYHDTEFYKACTSEKESVFFLDEMDASIPEVLVLLNAAIANGYFEFPTGRVDVKNVHFVAAGNTVGSGADELYTGRMVIDQATLDRFAIIEFGYDTNVEMKLAENDEDLVDFVHALRKSAESQGVRATFSYRCITMAKKLDNAGMDIVEIVKISVVKGLDMDTIRTIFPNTANSSNRFKRAFEQLMAA